MKLKALTIALFLGAGLMKANAQTGPYLGVTTSYNSTWVLDQKLMDDQNYDTQNTWDDSPIGFTLGYKVNPSSSIQVEINKNTMGAEFDILGSQIYDGEKSVIGEKNSETK